MEPHDPQDRQEQKKQLLTEVLARSWAWLHLDGRVPGVELPEWLRIPSVTLQIGYDMPLPIHDLAVDDWGVRATLSFRRTPYTCRVPWKAIFAIADFDGAGALFAEDMPPEMAAVAGATITEKPAAGARPLEEAPPAAGPPDPPPNEPPAGRSKSGKPRPSHLKLVS